ncbi:MAG: FAD-dependent oxidoreductase [Oceanidesulfovibrio sp.]
MISPERHSAQTAKPPPMNFAFVGPPRAATGRSVAVIGAGPSGLAASGYLAARGYVVHIYDKLPKAGGLMTFGIPGSRIPAQRIDDAVKTLVENYGVTLHMRTKICGADPLCETGDDYADRLESLGSLVEDHDAVLVCTGAWKSRPLDIPGNDLPGIYSSLEFLFPIRACEYDTGKINPMNVEDSNVVVIGAGHSAMDVAHESIRRGAANVYVLYRRTRDEAPCGVLEIESLEDAGGIWLECVEPLAFTGEDYLLGLRCRRSMMGSPDISGRRRPVPLPNSEFFQRADIVVTAVGEIPTPPFAHELGLDKVRRGGAHWLQMTAMPGVFVAGDVLIRPSKIGKATYSGLRAARSLHNWLELEFLGRQHEYDYAGDLISPLALA